MTPENEYQELLDLVMELTLGEFQIMVDVQYESLEAASRRQFIIGNYDWNLKFPNGAEINTDIFINADRSRIADRIFARLEDARNTFNKQTISDCLKRLRQ